MAIVPHNLAGAVDTASAAAMTFLVWEFCITLDQEVEYIWSKPSSSWVKWVFLFARYFTLATQSCSRIIEVAIMKGWPLAITPVKIWHVCRVLVAHLVMAACEIVLIVRVYAMYNQARWVLIFFITLMTAETGIVIFGIVHTMPREFVLLDAVTTLPSSFAYFGISVLVSQLAIIILSAIKYFRGQLGGGAPLVTLLVRDGTLAFGAVSLLSGIIIGYAFIHINISSWFIALASVTACRIILNMQALPANRATRTEETELQFTSMFRRTSFYDSSAMTISYAPQASTHNTPEPP